MTRFGLGGADRRQVCRMLVARPLARHSASVRSISCSTPARSFEYMRRVIVAISAWGISFTVLPVMS
jgi:hypothetical protein